MFVIVYICKSLQRTRFTFQEKQTPAESDCSVYHQDGGKSRLRFAPPGGLPPFTLSCLGTKTFVGTAFGFQAVGLHQDKGFCFSFISISFKHQTFFWKYLLVSLKKEKFESLWEKSSDIPFDTHSHTPRKHKVDLIAMMNEISSLFCYCDHYVHV